MQSVLALLVTFPLLALFLTDSVYAGELFVYPKNGQSSEQQKQDEFECYDWAKERSGFDPMAPPVTSSAPPAEEVPQGGVLRGAARGATTGAIAGAIGGDAGKGAAIGAATGGLIGGIRRRDQNRRQQSQQEAWAQQEAANYKNQRNNYNRAYASCLEARGYTVR